MNGLLKKSLLAATLAVTMAGSANAGYISLDWQEEGDELAFLDEDAGIEWLMLTETAGMSLNDVQAELGAGGLYEGWRFATATEVESIVADLTGDMEDQYATYTGTNNPDSIKAVYKGFSDLFGWSREITRDSGWSKEYDYRSYGLYFDDGSIEMAGVRWIKNPQTVSSTKFYSWSFTSTENSLYNNDYTAIGHGVYLVGDGGATLTTQEDMSLVSNNPLYANATAVPEPTGIALMAAGLLGLGAVRRRKQTKTGEA